MALIKISIPRLSRYDTKSKPKNRRRSLGLGVDWVQVPRRKPQTNDSRSLKDKGPFDLHEASIRLIPLTDPSASWLSPDVDLAMEDVRCSFFGVSQHTFHATKESVTALASAVDNVIWSFDELRVHLKSTDEICWDLKISSREIEDHYASLKDSPNVKLKTTMNLPGFDEATRRIQGNWAKNMAKGHAHLTALTKWSEVAAKRLDDLADLRITEAKAMYISKVRSGGGEFIDRWLTKLWLFSRSQHSAQNTGLSEFVPEVVDPMNKMLHSMKFLRYRLSILFNRMTYGLLTSEMASFSFVEAFELWKTTSEVWKGIQDEISRAKKAGEDEINEQPSTQAKDVVR